MDWTTDHEGHTYTTALGDCAATVTQTAPGSWTVTVRYAGTTVGQNGFTTLEAAQAWCERELVALAAADQCL